MAVPINNYLALGVIVNSLAAGDGVLHLSAADRKQCGRFSIIIFAPHINGKRNRPLVGCRVLGGDSPAFHEYLSDTGTGVADRFTVAPRRLDHAACLYGYRSRRTVQYSPARRRRNRSAIDNYLAIALVQYRVIYQRLNRPAAGHGHRGGTAVEHDPALRRRQLAAFNVHGGGVWAYIDYGRITAAQALYIRVAGQSHAVSNVYRSGITVVIRG